MLGPELTTEVLDVIRFQLEQARALTVPANGHPVQDRRADYSGWLIMRLTAEAQEAFPSESFKAFAPDIDEKAPDSYQQFLLRAPHREPARRDRELGARDLLMAFLFAIEQRLRGNPRLTTYDLRHLTASGQGRIRMRTIRSASTRASSLHAPASELTLVGSADD